MLKQLGYSTGLWLLTLSLLLSPSVLAEYTTNASIQETLDSLGTQTNQLNQRLSSVQRQHARLLTNEAALNEHIVALRGSGQVFRVLQEQNTNLPNFDFDPGLSDLIADARLRQFTVSQQQREIQDNPSDYPADLRLSELQDHLQELVVTAVSLQQAQQELTATADRVRSSIIEQLFWIPSNPAIGLGWFTTAPGALADQLTRLPAQFSVSLTPGDLSLWQWLGTLLFLPAIALYWLQPRLKTALATTLKTGTAAFYPTAPRAEPTSEAETTNSSPWSTLVALALTAAITAPASLALLAIGNLLSGTQETDTLVLGPALTAIALSLFVVQFLRSILAPGQIAEVDFQWPDHARKTLRTFVRRFAWVLLPTSAVLTLAVQQGATLSNDVLGPVILIVAGALVAYYFRVLLKQLPPGFAPAGVRWVLNLVLVLLPLSLVVLTLSGYYYTSLQLTGRFLATFYVLSGWVIAEASARRAIEVSSNRLRQQREAENQVLREQRDAQRAKDPDKIQEPLPDTTAELRQVRQQTQRLVRFLLLTGFGGLLYWVWADLVGVFGYLDSLVIWQYGSAESPGSMSLLDLASFFFIISLSLFLAANLPGLLEMLVLSRLSLRQGSAYAMTTLLNYIITGIGLVLALSSLGVSWDKLQWLVAALSVGLGFGLQEIFANFVSGLILLFERPIRIGDIVTLGDLSGVVRQIRIRATTITDFDRKDIIVPNKTFVTDQLINWSLTDTVTRVIVRVGVAYGSDLDKTRALLLSAAKANPRVLDEPEPQVLFLNFGASTLDHELRIHVKELQDRNPAIDEINRYIDREFKLAGIEIAFQQIDIHLRNSEGLDKLVSRQPPQTDQ
ncbi:mechanosensitive ion channel domain-containing protein [Saccharospirillum alexandrii]|uniref:mechanosensitive ion channel domain-containing protein n=1 Tax=Saccharospirillum alexandrii TaxID=2448477 RepID=UPI003735FC8B